MKVSLTSFLMVLGYLVGSIPTGAWLAQWYGRDITKFGSGNIGATNVGRLFGVTGFVTVFIIDALKAYCYLYFLKFFAAKHVVLVVGAFLLLLGNSYSPFLKFKGGKGVATSIGILLFLAPFFFLILFFVWLVTFLLVKTVGIASVATFLALILSSIIFFWGSWLYVALFIGMGFWGIVRHRDNINSYFKQL